MRSGWNAAIVLGATSAKISTMTVRIAVETSGPVVSPSRRMPITVAIAAADRFTRLLPSRIRPIMRSGCRSRFCARTAPLWPLLARCRRRYLLSAIRPVSALEKKPDSTINTVSTIKSVASGVSSNAVLFFPGLASDLPVLAQQLFQDQLGTKIGYQQHDCRGERQSDCSPATPAKTPAAKEQDAVDSPGDNTEHCLVH